MRIVAGPRGPVVDYRERLPGRAAYVCPRRECIESALSRETLSRALHSGLKVFDHESFLREMELAVTERIKGLLSMAMKARMIVSGYSAVENAVRTGKVALLLFAHDVSAATRDRIMRTAGPLGITAITLFSKSELGDLTGRDMSGSAALIEKGFADAVQIEVARLKGLLKKHR